MCSALLSVYPGGIEKRRQFSVPNSRFHGSHCEPKIIARRFLNQFTSDGGPWLSSLCWDSFYFRPSPASLLLHNAPLLLGRSAVCRDKCAGSDAACPAGRASARPHHPLPLHLGHHPGGDPAPLLLRPGRQHSGHRSRSAQQRDDHNHHNDHHNHSCGLATVRDGGERPEEDHHQPDGCLQLPGHRW